MATTVQTILDWAQDETKLGPFTATSTTTSNQCIRWINRIIFQVSKTCAREKSEIGKKVGSIASIDGTASYAMLAPDMIVPDKWGYILKTDSKSLITLITDKEALGYGFSTTQEAEPTAFSLDKDNNVILHPTPDAIYAVRIPYWYKQTDLTLTTSTIPFNYLFDEVILEVLCWKLHNREEYNMQQDSIWMQFIDQQVKAILDMRKPSFQLKGEC